MSEALFFNNAKQTRQGCFLSSNSNKNKRKKHLREILGYGMGNSDSSEAVEDNKSCGFEKFDSSIFATTSTHGETVVCVPEVPAPPSAFVCYKRYYPKDINKHRPASRFFRSTSLQLHFTEHGSPIAKKARTTNDSFLSLPLSPTAQTLPETSNATVTCLSPTEEETDCQTPNDQGTFLQPGPITTAVLQSGLKAKVKSISSWFLTDHIKRHQDTKTVTSSKSFGSISRLQESLRSLNKFSPLNFRKRKRTESVSVTSEQFSTASLNSLGDGRTPWPIPWLEAVFLPEYPNRGPISEKHFQILGTIARGAFGKVYRVCLKAQPTAIFAMKVQNKSDVISNDAIRQMKDEVSIHESLGQSVFIAHLYASWQSRTKLFTVLEYATGYGDLYELWRDKGPFNENLVSLYAAETATALDFIHCHGIIYRDLKLENIVLDDNGHIQLVDFGLAKWLGVGDRTQTICGTLEYMAPEVASGNGYDHAVDYWSLGVLIYVLLMGSYPFASASDHLSLNFDFPHTPTTFTPALKDLLSQLLCIDPCQRLQHFGDIQEMDFFKPIDFDALSNKEIHPFDNISGMKHCNSCNTLTQIEPDYENFSLNGFQEQYEFSQPEYFDDKIK